MLSPSNVSSGICLPKQKQKQQPMYAMIVAMATSERELTLKEAVSTAPVQAAGWVLDVTIWKTAKTCVSLPCDIICPCQLCLIN